MHKNGMKGKCCGTMIAWILVIIGGLNWGLIGIGGDSWNLVGLLLGRVEVIERIVYVLVGVSALVLIFGCRCKKCKVKPEAPQENRPQM